MWGYGTTFEQYQKAMTEPTRGIYRAYIHTDGFFEPPSEEKQGPPPADLPIRRTPGPEVLDALKTRVSREVNALLVQDRPLDQMQMQFLARAYTVKWTPAFQNPAVVSQIVKGLDALFAAYRQIPKLAQSDPATPNPDWFGIGPTGDVLRRLAGPLAPALDQEIGDGATGHVSRREALAGMLLACRDWHREDRRQYTAQSMINDLYGIYLANRGLQVVAPDRAMPEQEARRYLYESVGLQPWLGSEKGGVPTKPLGDDYWQLTRKGLTKELGYVGYYGEVLDWTAAIYDATQPAPGESGDERIKAQLVKIARARAPFRCPMPDADGHRAMRAETIVGWRDEGNYPGDVTYGERPTWDASPIHTAAVTLDPLMVGAAQQAFGDNQFFASVRDQMKSDGLRATAASWKPRTSMSAFKPCRPARCACR